ncbi:MAG: hypothetical protein J6Z13_00330, partial [Clostridia bacterium]|nr:hypothetical protein [Clostridia bacterium]
METSFQNGKIIARGKFWEDAVYDVCANDLRVRFDGKGGITNYSVCNHPGSYVRTTYLNVFVNGVKLDAFTDKTVEMIGRTQKITIDADGGKIEVFQFVPKRGNALCCEITAEKHAKYDFAFVFGNASKTFAYAADAENEHVTENHSVYLHTDKSVRFVCAFGSDEENCKDILSRFTTLKKEVEDEIKSVRIPATAKTERDKALYVLSVFCALENYQEVGEYRGFSAGCNYINPLRTYFRDAYWTVLCMYKDHADLVRNEILTLAQGIDVNGDCPSAVTFELFPHWQNHYDSPSFFVMMVYDYINRTGDFSILDEAVRGKTVYDYCLLTINKLSAYEDDAHLIVKEGPYNKRDWADEVNRIGYVSYLELLYARALYCVSKIAGTRNEKLAAKYYGMYLQTKDAIDKILWDEEKGYYINYKNGDFVEDNLSVDTVVAVLFGISDEEKTKRLLDNVSKMLESKNNKIQRAGDFGVMSVFPFYKGEDRYYNKSSQDYEYHNGAVWPYLAALVAYAEAKNGRD